MRPGDLANQGALGSGREHLEHKKHGQPVERLGNIRNGTRAETVLTEATAHGESEVPPDRAHVVLRRRGGWPLYDPVASSQLGRMDVGCLRSLSAVDDVVLNASFSHQRDRRLDLLGEDDNVRAAVVWLDGPVTIRRAEVTELTFFPWRTGFRLGQRPHSPRNAVTVKASRDPSEPSTEAGLL